MKPGHIILPGQQFMPPPAPEPHTHGPGCQHTTDWEPFREQLTRHHERKERTKNQKSTPSRITLHPWIFFGEIEGDATITNISTSGCRAESDINLAEGLDVQVVLQLPDQSPPVKVERASVRWVSGHAFGLSFILFFPSERARLRTFLETIK